MKLEIFEQINRYSDAVMDVLAQHEIQNNLLISNCLRGREGRDTSDCSWAL